MLLHTRHRHVSKLHPTLMTSSPSHRSLSKSKPHWSGLSIATLALMSLSFLSAFGEPELLSSTFWSEESTHPLLNKYFTPKIRYRIPKVLQFITQSVTTASTLKTRNTSTLDKSITGLNELASVVPLFGLFEHTMPRPLLHTTTIIGGLSSFLSMISAGMKLDDASKQSLTKKDRTTLRQEGILGMVLGTLGTVHMLTVGFDMYLTERERQYAALPSFNDDIITLAPDVSDVREAVQNWIQRFDITLKREYLIKFPLLTQLLLRNPIELGDTILTDSNSNPSSTNPSKSPFINSTDSSLSSLHSLHRRHGVEKRFNPF